MDRYHHVLDYAIELAEANTTERKTQIHYSYKQKFASIQDMHDTVSTLCEVVNAAPWELGILAAATGKMRGVYTIQYTEGPDYVNNGHQGKLNYWLHR